ncbi:MAG: radical SAM protein [Planctomycetes bacterium]|nr:radical SAM protein [Planctomycetota bacterium]
MRRAYKSAFNQWSNDSTRRRGILGLLLKALYAHVRPGLIPPFTSPILATIELTRRCNLHCRDCVSHHPENPNDDESSWKQIIRELAAAEVVALGFTGGEPLLLPYFERLASLAARSGLVTHLNTNGTLITTDRAKSLLNTGLHSINLSLDGSDALTHDPLRNAGSFDQALRGAEQLVRARERSGTETRLLFVMRLCSENAHQATNLLDLCREVGFDGCSYMPLMIPPVKGNRSPQPQAARAAKALLDRRSDPRIDNSARYLKGMARYFLGGAMPLRCSALHSSILVSAEQTIYPCVPAVLYRQGGISWKPGAMFETFSSPLLRRCIDDSLCAGCWWNCHRELDLALGVI